MVTDTERENPLSLLHGLLFPRDILCAASHKQDSHTTALLGPYTNCGAFEGNETVQWVHLMGSNSSLHT